VIVGFTCLVQLLVSMMIDSRYERDLLRYYVWMIWYPIAYWLLSLTTTVAAVPKVMARGKGARATWVSPDRGLRKAS
jgi:poly-beta-1,6-N-acetyl-D-glucosamine synthase